VDPNKLMLLVVALGLALAASACVDARCTRNAECPAGKVCVTATGACEAPECTSDGECGAGRVCDQFACVSGCRADAECADDQRCFANHCVPRDEACDCPTAPRFCGVDLNPLSPTAGDPVCVPDTFDAGGLLFFGSVMCSHCQSVLAALEAVQAQVAASGTAPLVFVQEPTIEVGSATVEGSLSGSTVVVLQDDPDKGVWPAYGADWYHAVLIDRNGCLAKHWGSLVDERGAVILDVAATRAAWLEARQAACAPAPRDAAEIVEPGPDTTEPAPDASGPGPDVTLDPGPGAALDARPDAVPDAVPVPDSSDPVEVASESFEAPLEVADAPPEAVVDLWVEPFSLQDICQAVSEAPAIVGGLVPHFLCKDVNTASAAYGGAVSDVTLREQVWIAYFGTCT
jgi:hypothetical protein